jgi:hypothetical protein
MGNRGLMWDSSLSAYMVLTALAIRSHARDTEVSETRMQDLTSRTEPQVTASAEDSPKDDSTLATTPTSDDSADITQVHVTRPAASRDPNTESRSASVQGQYERSHEEEEEEEVSLGQMQEGWTPLNVGKK